MKNLHYLLKGLAAAALMVVFTQCTSTQTTDGTDASEQNASALAAAPGELSGMKIAFVEIDSLLLKYYLSVDLNEAMVKKSENMRLNLNQRASELEKQKQEFQTKYQNNAYLSQERAQQEYNRIAKLEQDLQTSANKQQAELVSENEKNSILLRDSINAFLKAYNKTRGYSLIISNTGFDNLLYGDPALNITKEIVDGLNARYTSKKK
ncbi:MAG: OmpH family outer membrane protein [Prevotellaceae bacterium]|jgi:outer membrane protein|nr:OmpH family outer membrane protein [Prevotellaceae bacterium]